MIRPKARFFTFLSVVWLPVVGLGFLLFSAESANTGSEWSWAYLLPALPELVSIAVAAFYWITEEPRSTRERHPNPDFDLRKLY